MTAKPERSNLLPILAGLLLGLGVLYIGLRPRLQHLSKEAARLNQEAAELQKPQTFPTSLASETASAVEVAWREPQSFTAQMQAAMTLDRAGRFDDAKKFARRAIKLQSDDVSVQVVLAEIQRRNREYFESMITYRNAVKAHPNDVRASVGLGSLYISFGWTLDALDVLNDGLKTNPDSTGLKVTLALANLQQDNLGQAEKLLQEVRSAAPTDASLWSPLVDVYNKAHRYADAIATAQAVFKWVHNDVNVIDELAQAYLESGQVQQAISEYQRATTLAPNNPVPHYGLGRAYMRANREEDAQQEFEKVIQTAPDYADTRLLLGQIYLRRNRSEEGKSLLKQFREKQAAAEKAKHLGYVLSNRTHDPDAHWKMASAYVALKDTPHAILELKRTLEIDPNHAAAKAELAKLN